MEENENGSFLFAFSPNLLPHMNDLVRTVPEPEKQINFIDTFLIILQISATAAVLEELVYRGMLLPALRRCRIFIKQVYWDFIAISICSLLFGLAHIPMWGIKAFLPITFLGIGFGLAAIANQERLRALITYHFIFDVLSFTALYLGLKFY